MSSSVSAACVLSQMRLGECGVGGALGQSHPHRTPVHIFHRAPTHLHGLLQVLGGCTGSVEGGVLHNAVDPLTSRVHHTKSPPLHLPDVNVYVNIQCKLSERYSGGYNYI